MEWTGHMVVPGALGLGEKRRLSPGEMTRLLGEFRRGSPAEFIVPRSAPDSPLPEMRCFDPARCRCLHYVGREDLPKEWWGGKDGGSGGETCCGSPSEGAAGMIAGTHTSRCILSRDSETQIDINPCGVRSSCLAITYRRTIQVAAAGEECRAVTQSWLEAIDPASYTGVAIGDEARPFDVLTCPHDDPACANYGRYLERPVVREFGRDDLTLREHHSPWGMRRTKKEKRLGIKDKGENEKDKGGNRKEKGEKEKEEKGQEKRKKEKKERKEKEKGEEEESQDYGVAEGEDVPRNLQVWGRFWLFAHVRTWILGWAFIVVLAFFLLLHRLFYYYTYAYHF